MPNLAITLKDCRPGAATADIGDARIVRGDGARGSGARARLLGGIKQDRGMGMRMWDVDAGTTSLRSMVLGGEDEEEKSEIIGGAGVE